MPSTPTFSSPSRKRSSNWRTAAKASRVSRPASGSAGTGREDAETRAVPSPRRSSPLKSPLTDPVRTSTRSSPARRRSASSIMYGSLSIPVTEPSGPSASSRSVTKPGPLQSRARARHAEGPDGAAPHPPSARRSPPAPAAALRSSSARCGYRAKMRRLSWSRCSLVMLATSRGSAPVCSSCCGCERRADRPAATDNSGEDRNWPGESGSVRWPPTSSH
jgi:hypothetical protein